MILGKNGQSVKHLIPSENPNFHFHERDSVEVNGYQIRPPYEIQNTYIKNSVPNDGKIRLNGNNNKSNSRRKGVIKQPKGRDDIKLGENEP